MRTDHAFICDYALEAGGKVHAVGIGWTNIQTSLMPVTHSTMTLVVRLSGSIAEAGTKEVGLKLIDADGANVLAPFEREVEFVVDPPALEGQMNIVANFNAVMFEKYGQYAFHVLVQGTEMARVPFTITEISPTT